MNSPVTRERYSTRLRSFFVHIGIGGTTMQERCRRFVEKVKVSEEENGNSKWAYAYVIKFLQHQKNRCDKKEIAGSTVRGYYKAVKLFAEVNDNILLPWSRIKRGLKYKEMLIATVKDSLEIWRLKQRKNRIRGLWHNTETKQE
jgi:hypothetical protein